MKANYETLLNALTNEMQALHKELQECKEKLSQEPCEDAVSRQAVLDKMKERDEELSSICPKDIKDLPSVTPQPNTGYWEWKPHPVLPYTGNWYCSECNLIGSAVYDYCPSCGAKMQEVEE